VNDLAHQHPGSFETEPSRKFSAIVLKRFARHATAGASRGRG